MKTVITSLCVIISLSAAASNPPYTSRQDIQRDHRASAEEVCSDDNQKAVRTTKSESHFEYTDSYRQTHTGTQNHYEGSMGVNAELKGEIKKVGKAGGDAGLDAKMSRDGERDDSERSGSVTTYWKCE